MKKLRYLFEYIIICFFYAFFKIMSWKCASNTGGWIARKIGPRLAASRKAMRHIRLAFPDKKDEELHQIMVGMWDNLGRVFAEYPHIKTIAKSNIKTIGEEHLQSLRDDNSPGIVIGAHLANWELAPHIFAHHGLLTHSVYRRPNNPHVARLIEKLRTPAGHKGGMLGANKSRTGMMKIVKAMKNGEHIAMLVDQKYNEGIDAQFFGHNARTSTAFADLSKKFKCPLHMGRIVRKNGTEFIAELLPAMNIDIQDGQNTVQTKSNEAFVNQYHAQLEAWITENPEQWLWLHRRWRGI